MTKPQKKANPAPRFDPAALDQLLGTGRTICRRDGRILSQRTDFELPRNRVRFPPRISARNATSCRRNQDDLRATELLTRLLYLDLMPALRERVTHVRRNPWLDPESLAAVPAEARSLDRLLRR